jgi:hypothetical protein
MALLPKPTGLGATPLSANSIRLNWTNGHLYEYVLIERKQEGGSFAQIDSIQGDFTEYVDSGLVGYTTYIYRVRGNLDPDYSFYSDEASAKTLPQEPSGVTVTPLSKTSLKIDWTNNDTYNELRVYYKREDEWDWAGYLSPSPTATTITQSGAPYMQAGTKYSYALMAIKGGLQSVLSPTVEGATIPEEPTDLVVEPGSGGSLELRWTNGDDSYELVEIWRKVGAGSFSLYLSFAGDSASFTDVFCEQGSTYTYKVRGKKNGVYSAYSNEAGTMNKIRPPHGLSGTCLSKTSVQLKWVAYGLNQTGFKVYRDGTYLTTVLETGSGDFDYTDSTCAAGVWYRYYVTAYNAETESGPSNEITIFTWDPPRAPSDLVARAVSITRIDLQWVDNTDNEDGFYIERSDNGVDFAQTDSVGPNIQAFSDTTGSSNHLYYYRVRAYNSSGYSAYSNIAHAQTFAAISTPTNLVALVWSDTIISLTWQNNSTEEDCHCIERNTNGGGWVEVGQVLPNVNFYLDSGLVYGNTYGHRVRAKQGSSYSNYSNETSTTAAVPAAPTNLAVAEHTNTTMRLTWTRTMNEVGYKIEKSTNGGVDYTEIAVIGAGIEYFLARGLTPGATVYFKIRAYNAAGNSAYTSAVSHATDSTYQPTDFDLFMRRQNIRPVFLCEINPIMELSGFSLTAGKSYTYEVVLDEHGVDIEYAYQNGVELTEKASPTEVEAAASSFYFDFENQKLYVHTSDGTDPSKYTITVSFWIFFTNYKSATYMMDFNGNNYLNLLSADGVPDISQEIKPIYEGNFIISSGSFSLINGKIGKAHYFDKRYSRYEWRNRKVVWRIGKEDWAYSKFKLFYTGLITSKDIDDRRITFTMRDMRENFNRKVPLAKYTAAEYYNLDPGAVNRVKPFFYGVVVDFIPPLIDIVRRQYQFHAGRAYSVQAIKQNDVALTIGTDVFVDYQRGIFTVKQTLTWDIKDIFTIDFHGTTDDAGGEISNGAEIFKHVMMYFLSAKNADLDFDSIYETKYANTEALSVLIYSEKDSDEIIKTLQASVRAYTFQDEQGRIGFKMSKTTPESNARYVRNHQIWNFSQSASLESLFKTIEIYYNENPKTQPQYSMVTRTLNKADWIQGAKGILKIYSYLNNVSAANTLANYVQAECNKDFAKFETTFNLFGCMPGDLIYFDRARFFNLNGTAKELVLRILKIQRKIAAKKIGIVVEEVSS